MLTPSDVVHGVPAPIVESRYQSGGSEARPERRSPARVESASWQLTRLLSDAGPRLVGILTEKPNIGRMGGSAMFTLADTRQSIENFVTVFLYIYMLLIFLYILTSWVRLPYNVWLNRIQRFLYDVCEPYLRLFRRFLPPLGPLDLSPVVAVIVLVVLLNVVQAVL